MSTPEQDQAPVVDEEQLFLRNALAGVERVARFQRIKYLVLSVIILPAVYYLMDNPREHPTFSVVGVIGLIVGLCTAKILAQLTSNTRAVLRAIAALPQK